MTDQTKANERLDSTRKLHRDGTCALLMTDNKQGAYGARASDTDFRRKWDKEEYAEKARQKDEEERLRMQENEERMKQGTTASTSLGHHARKGTNSLGFISPVRQETYQGKEEGSPEAHRAHETARPRPRTRKEPGQNHGRPEPRRQRSRPARIPLRSLQQDVQGQRRLPRPHQRASASVTLSSLPSPPISQMI